MHCRESPANVDADLVLVRFYRDLSGRLALGRVSFCREFP